MMRGRGSHYDPRTLAHGIIAFDDVVGGGRGRGGGGRERV